jgi:uncharacterized membrane protein YidH (DUF202 family)
LSQPSQLHTFANTLPAERTTLAWTRTSFAVLGNGALLAIKDLHGFEGLTRLIAPVLAALVATCTYLIALRRQRTLRQRPLPARISARPQVYTVGFGVLLLIVVTAVTQLV